MKQVSLVVHTCNPRIEEVDTEASGVPRKPEFYIKFEAYLGYSIHCLKKKKKGMKT